MVRKRIAKQKIQQFDMKVSELNVNINTIRNQHFNQFLYSLQLKIFRYKTIFKNED